MSKLAVVRIRSKVGMRETMFRTLKMLRLYRRNYCSVIENTPSTKGMVEKVKSFVTFGEISDEFYAKLIEKKGEPFLGRTQDSKGKIKYSFAEHAGKKYKPFFRLSPPRKGFGRKGIKTPFSQGGALGDRGEKISELIERMI